MNNSDIVKGYRVTKQFGDGVQCGLSAYACVPWERDHPCQT